MANKGSKQTHGPTEPVSSIETPQCPSCLIVLNQDTCYFSEHSSTQDVAETSHSNKLPLTTLEHCQRAPSIFTAEFLPPQADNDSILKSLVSNPDYHTSPLSRPLVSHNPADIVTATNRLQHAKSYSTFYRYVAHLHVIANDLAVPDTIADPDHPGKRLTLSYPKEVLEILNSKVTAELKALFDEYKRSQSNSPSDTKFMDLSSLFTQYRTTTENDIRKIQADIASFPKYTEASTVSNVPQHGRSPSYDQTLKPTRAPTPRAPPAETIFRRTSTSLSPSQGAPDPRPAATVAPSSLQPARTNPPPPSGETSHHATSTQNVDNVSPLISEESSDEKEEDARSIRSNGTVHTVNPSSEHSPPYRRSEEPESPALARPKSLVDHSDTNLDSWIDYLSTKTSRFRRPPSDPKNDKPEANRIFHDYVSKRPPNREFAKRLTEEILSTITSARSNSRPKKT